MADRIARSELQAVHDLHMRETIVLEAMEWGSCYPHQGKEPEGCGDCARDVLHDEVKRLHAVEEVARKMAKTLEYINADSSARLNTGGWNALNECLALPLVSELLKGQK